MIQLLTFGLALGVGTGRLQSLVSQAVDIAPSAYQFRADRKVDANPPESWIAVKYAAHLPVNKPVDVNSQAIRHTLCGLLWEEIRPVQVLELTWPDSGKRPRPDELQLTALINHGSASSWWNNLDAVVENVRPTVSAGGRTYTYALGQDTCGLVVSAVGDAHEFDVPTMRVLTPDTWKQMDVEIEWGFDSARAAKDYSGHIETYDGRVADVQALEGDPRTAVHGEAWNSSGMSQGRRGIKMSLLYQGISKWRKQQPYTTQPEDVARSIVTIWTKSGSFSFLAADLENGPILAPEYGFFVRRTSRLTPSAEGLRKVTPVPMTTRMDSVLGDNRLKGWGTAETPLVAANPTVEVVSQQGVTFPPRSLAMHPGQFRNVVAEWHSPISGEVTAPATLTHAQAGGSGIQWWLIRNGSGQQTVLSHGVSDGDPAKSNPTGPIKPLSVEKGDTLSLVIAPRLSYICCSTLVDWTIKEVGGQGRVWNAAKDVSPDAIAANPHSDGLGNSDVWRFYSDMPMFLPHGAPSDPPIDLSSNAASAKEFEAELAAKHLQTIREQTRKHPEMTWEEAVAATRGPNLPPHPSPPVGSEPSMKVDVPSERLTAQWNLGAWHLLRHCATNPTTGKLWFNDFPYGILAAETYMVLEVLDLMGSHEAAADGYQQWTSLPLARNPAGVDPAKALPDHPVGLFTEGYGAFTNAVGPDGYGGNMDTVHAFGPGAIGWALTQHYWLSGDTAWLKASAPRLEANAEWLLRQRHVISDSMPGGDRLWCNGLVPPRQVTPDSGGLWMQFYEAEAYYWAAISRLATTVEGVDPAGAAKLKREAEAYGRDLRASVDRSITLSPVVPIRDGTYHSVVPFAPYCRGLSTGAWGYERDGSGTHVGPLYWDTVQSAAALVSPAGVLATDDVRVQGYFDVLEDRPLLENANVGNRNWFYAGWQYQGGLERTANMHLEADDIPVFLRSFFNCYAVDILPNDGYVFNEHAVHGPPDKIFEEAAFLERMRNMLVMEEGQGLWLARGTPREWLAQGKHISVAHAPTRFGDVDYKIESDVDNNLITATITMPSRNRPALVVLRVRHPSARPISSVLVNGKAWKGFDAKREVVKLRGLSGKVVVQVRY